MLIFGICVKCIISSLFSTFSRAIFLIVALDFINVASSGGGVIANINLESFMPTKDLGTVDICFSDDGSRLCIVYGDGSVSVVDRNIYLQENPQRRSWAFQYTADDGRETPSSIAASFEKSARLFSISPGQSRSPSVLSNIDASEEELVETVSLAGLERKTIHRSESASASSKYLPDVVPVWRHGSLGSCPVLSPKSAFFRVESCSSINEEEPLTCSPSYSRIASPTVDETEEHSRRTSIPLDMSYSRICPSSPAPAGADVSQEKAACRYFRLPYWNDRAQCRKLIWSKTRLFIWLSLHNALGMEEHIVILFSLSRDKVFSYRSAVEHALYYSIV